MLYTTIPKENIYSREYYLEFLEILRKLENEYMLSAKSTIIMMLD